MSGLQFKGPDPLNQATGAVLMEQVRKAKVPSGSTVTIDLAQTHSMDSLGGASLVAISDYLRSRKCTLTIDGKHGEVASFLEIVEPALAPLERRGPPRETFITHLGGFTIDVFNEFLEFGGLVVDSIYWTLLAPFEGRGFRWNALFDELHEMGVRAVRICMLMNFLLGVIIAMLFAKQAEKYGLQLWVADGIMQGFARELAAIMTAIIVSARTGAAITAELATMKVQEEIDALRGMGLNVNQFLVAPKLLALLIVMPCLVVLGLFSGIFGGFLWGVLVLKFPPVVWINQTIAAAHSAEIFEGLFKSLFFAIGIALIGCHNGLRVRGGSRGVGLMTTRSVVMDIFMIICVDMTFATMFYYVLV
jgi:phospholipid/cholesterol/gamma-HCH transport system permease protein